MDFQKAILYCPERLIWRGFGVIGMACLLLSCFLMSLYKEGPWEMVFEERATVLAEDPPLFFALRQTRKGFSIPLPNIAAEAEFFLQPPRPGGEIQEKRLLMRLKKSGQFRQVELPCRIDLEYGEQNQLVTALAPSPFWIELEKTTGSAISGKVCLQIAVKDPYESTPFIAPLQESPYQTAEELPDGSPFKLLAEAKWLGPDLVRARYGEVHGGMQRLEWGSGEEERFEMGEGEWIVWSQGKWHKGAVETAAPIAKVASVQEKLLVLEGWEGDRYARIALNPANVSPLKVRGEDLFSSIRARSDKQISCMLEKQCLILKTGDWVVKTKGRWKVLRTKEDRDAFVNGKWVGELIVFEGIETKQGQKVIQGRFFHANRSQTVAIEAPAQLRKSAAGVKPR